jgi:hypothetical protein
MAPGGSTSTWALHNARSQADASLYAPFAAADKLVQRLVKRRINPSIENSMEGVMEEMTA